LLLVR
ncbi:ABC transporter, phosphonate, periplasmic substrate-binding protein, partial [Haemophilus influenzae]